MPVVRNAKNIYLENFVADENTKFMLAKMSCFTVGGNNWPMASAFKITITHSNTHTLIDQRGYLKVNRQVMGLTSACEHK